MILFKANGQAKRFLFIVLISFLPPVAQAEIKIPFDGKLDLLQRQLELSVYPSNASPVVIQFRQDDEKTYHLGVNLDKLHTPFFDISTILEGTVEIIKDETRSIRSLSGKLESRYTLINYKPVEELVGQFEIRDSTLMIHSLSVGNLVYKGEVQLAAPYNVDVTVELQDVPLPDFIAFFSPNKQAPSEGLVSGTIHLGGTLSHFHLRGNVVSDSGFVKPLEFKNITLNAEGYYPNIAIANSTITKADGMSFSIVGDLDLGDHDHLDKQIESLKVEALVSQAGTEAEWTLKRVKSDSDKVASTTELKYLMRKEDNSADPTREDSGMLGVEKKVEF